MSLLSASPHFEEEKLAETLPHRTPKATAHIQMQGLSRKTKKIALTFCFLLVEEEGAALLHLLLRRLPEQTVFASGAAGDCCLVVAGCTNADLTSECRCGLEHFLNCFYIDSVYD
jgi:hypothetical protein